MQPLDRLLHALNRLEHAGNAVSRAVAVAELEEILAMPLPGSVDAPALRRALRAGSARSGTVYQALDEPLGYPGSRLLVYGSLAPGQQHHDELAGLPGRWLPARVAGHVARGGAYPRFYWSPGAAPLEVLCLESAALPAHWPRLDAFEGDEYRRILVPAAIAGADRIASIYAAA
jgi:gamma-glutamylcyclotransferase (GGCT)/AIG2-like uncharacterized protein YtfP